MARSVVKTAWPCSSQLWHLNIISQACELIDSLHEYEILFLSVGLLLALSGLEAQVLIFFVVLPTSVNRPPHNSVLPAPCPFSYSHSCSSWDYRLVRKASLKSSGEKLVWVNCKWHFLPDSFCFLAQWLGLQCVRRLKKAGQKQRKVGIKKIIKFTDFLKLNWQVGMFSDIIPISYLKITLTADSRGCSILTICLYLVLTVQSVIPCMPLESAAIVMVTVVPAWSWTVTPCGVN